MAVETINQNQEVLEQEVVEVVEQEVVTQEEVEAVEQETPTFEKRVTLSGKILSFSWDEEDDKQIARMFGGFNTTINDVLYRTEIGIDEEGITTIVISFNGELTSEIMNYIISHIIGVSVDTCEANDQVFFNQTVEGTMNAADYVMTKPVIEAVGILHTWVNISHFQSDNEESGEVNVDVAKEQEAVEVESEVEIEE